jgi:hypothetical protein
MGLPDILPENFSGPVLQKLKYIHLLISRAKKHSQNQLQAVNR